jgi:hypothetical protein
VSPFARPEPGARAFDRTDRAGAASRGAVDHPGKAKARRADSGKRPDGECRQVKQVLGTRKGA